LTSKLLGCLSPTSTTSSAAPSTYCWGVSKEENVAAGDIKLPPGIAAELDALATFSD
jgi:hypothetical protein